VKALLKKIPACEHCSEHLALGPRPVVQAHPDARIMIIGQAPGTRVHESGVPWNDPSGRLLREWMAIDDETFYDPKRIALMPMGFCYPGKGKSGDLPPRPECAPLWHEKLLAQMKQIRLTVLIGQYSQRHYLGVDKKLTLTEIVRAFRDHLPTKLPLPHPSPRNRLWLKKNPWFEEEVVPEFKTRVRRALKSGS
jgi:uracil-DNA glycosylase